MNQHLQPILLITFTSKTECSMRKNVGKDLILCIWDCLDDEKSVFPFFDATAGYSNMETCYYEKFWPL